MNNIKIGNLDIFFSVYEYINSNMYIIRNGKRALVADPHVDINVLTVLGGVEEVTIVLTHEHPDHISGIYWFQERFNTKLISTKNCSKYISNIRNIRPILMTFYLEEQDRLKGTNLLKKFNSEYALRTYVSDITFEEKYYTEFCGHNLEFFKILGHSKGSCGIIFDGNVVFTGDSLLKDLPIITRFPGGNKKTYISETLPMLEQKLKPDMWIMPGHGEPFQLKEIMKDGKINVEFR